jgi:hypothetical protein
MKSSWNKNRVADLQILIFFGTTLLLRLFDVASTTTSRASPTLCLPLYSDQGSIETENATKHRDGRIWPCFKRLLGNVESELESG